MTEISKEYASALFSLAGEKQCEDAWGESLARVSGLFARNPDYPVLLASPDVPVEEREQLIEKALGGTEPEEILSFLKLLIRRGRIRMLPACRAEYEKLLHIKEQVSTARVVSAAPLTEEERTRLLQRLEKLSGHTVLLTCEVDATLLGGAVVEMDGRVMDGSVRGRLREIKEVIGG